MHSAYFLLAFTLLSTFPSSVLLEDPLYLTPLIEKGEIERARKLSEVKPLLPGVFSYSGFLTTDASCGSNFFFWFFPADTDWKSAPLTIWLQGGPGMPSLHGILFEHGPIKLSKNDKLELREERWTKTSSMLYFDTPLGTGWSHTARDDCYSKTAMEIAGHLIKALRQFYKLFSELLPNPLYIFSEGNGSKTCLSLASLIHDANANGEQVINLQGIGMGAPYIEPFVHTVYANHLYNLGFLDELQREEMLGEEQILRDLLTAKNYTAAYLKWAHIITGSNSLFVQHSGHHNIYNIELVDITLTTAMSLTMVIKDTGIADSVHVGDVMFSPRTLALSYFQAEMVSNVIDLMEKIIARYNVLIFDGQFDIGISPYHTTEWIKKLQWAGAEEYKMAPRQFWYVGNDLAGYWKKAGKLTTIFLRNTGFLVAHDQAAFAQDMFHRFINDLPFANKKVFKPDDWQL